MIGRMLWRLSIVLLAFATICAGALSALALWVLFGFPPEPRKTDADPLGAQFEARKGKSPGGGGPLNLTGASRQELRRDPQGVPVAEAASPSSAASGASPPVLSADSGGPSDRDSLVGSGSSSAAAAEPAKPGKDTQTDPGAGADRPQLARTEPEDHRSAAPQQQVSKTLTDLRPRLQCNINACASRYNSFHAADCTYQPLRGGPRRLCELSARSADTPSQYSRAAADLRFEAKDARVAETTTEIPKAATAARGTQCHVDLCAATYASFHATDCTYQPYDGGPRRVCEL